MIDLRIGDCREVLRTLPDACADVVIADPPYGDTSCDWDKQVDGWLDELPRVLKLSGSLWCFGSMRFFLDRGADFRDWKYAQDLVWEKQNGSASFSDRFRRVHELIVQFYPADRPWADVYRKPQFTSDATARTIRRKQKPQHWGGIGPATYKSEDGGPRLLRSVLYCRSEHGRAEHETQKPAHLLLPLIEYSCPQGGGSTRPDGRQRHDRHRRSRDRSQRRPHRTSTGGCRDCAQTHWQRCAAAASG